MSGQSPPSEHDQLGWLMGEVDRLRAEIEQQARSFEEERNLYQRLHRDARAELEQARKEVDAALAMREQYEEKFDGLEAELEQARKALAAYRSATRCREPESDQLRKMGDDALAGKGRP